MGLIANADIAGVRDLGEQEFISLKGPRDDGRRNREFSPLRGM